jgi:HSP20 family protein
MAEVRVTKEPKTEYLPTWFGFEAPFARNFFATSPFGFLKFFSDEANRILGYKPATTPPEVWSPAIEVKQEKGRLLVIAELPGVNFEDVKAHVVGDALVIEGERKFEKEEKRGEYFHTERRYGRFYRAIPLPEGANVEKASASFNNGVLTVALPVPEVVPKAREIPVTKGAPVKTETTH